uniref:Uncharacterized protein n=1 Tax=Naja naja TaxID=35670 RepID=A0A8C6X5P1_NAJNA
EMKGLWFAFLLGSSQTLLPQSFLLTVNQLFMFNCYDFLLGLCLILFSSGFNTEHYVYTEGHPYYGLFHLSGLIWCTDGRHNSQNICRIDCER